MDSIQYMNDYASWLTALESIDSDEPAMESIEGDTKVIADYFNQSMSHLIADYRAALRDEDLEGAIKALNEIEKLIKRCQKDMDRIPPEKQSTRNIRMIAKIAAILLSIYIGIGSTAITAKITTILANAGVKNPAAVAKFGVKFATRRMRKAAEKEPLSNYIGNGANPSLSQQGGIKAIVDAFIITIIPETKEKYADDPKKVSRAYLKMRQTLDQLLDQMQLVKSELKKELQESAKKEEA